MGVNGIGNIVRRLAEDGGLKHAQHMTNQSMKRNVFLETTFDVIKVGLICKTELYHYFLCFVAWW